MKRNGSESSLSSCTCQIDIRWLLAEVLGRSVLKGTINYTTIWKDRFKVGTIYHPHQTTLDDMIAPWAISKRDKRVMLWSVLMFNRPSRAFSVAHPVYFSTRTPVDSVKLLCRLSLASEAGVDSTSRYNLWLWISQGYAIDVELCSISRYDRWRIYSSLAHPESGSWSLLPVPSYPKPAARVRKVSRW